MKQGRLMKQDEPKHWRIRAKSSDGVVVTLGRYETETKARADCDAYIKDGFYRDVVVDHIKPAETAPSGEETSTEGSDSTAESGSAAATDSASESTPNAAPQQV